MPSKKREHIDGLEDDLTPAEEPPAIDPYKVLVIEKNATPEEVKSAYRRQALKHHPDKVAEADKAAAHVKFQEIALAYAVLSDERRRKRYDITGRTDESLVVDGENGDFDWASFYKEQFEDAISADNIEAFAQEYRDSDEELRDVLGAYDDVDGDMAQLYEFVMLSNPEQDEDRFRAIIDKAIANREVEAYPKYTKETAKARKRRIVAASKTAGREAQEAEEMAKELGLKKSKGKKDGDTSDLAALIKKRQESRAVSFFDNLESKYGAGLKHAQDEPSEEAFAKNRRPKKKGKTSG